ncbi:hypothetical protein AK812_SmicGene6391 [Symbiodinium microadriaticum]|uniref:Uncharacterized protein n=1 Tax=Symbiodinium microadriaticum TaxID=2951 RepID=A0A1Q9ER86_SYMMI|nr:hypothetical protein AK812_SmicGene6391 [Symbiodinium microadriaticum]
MVIMRWSMMLKRELWADEDWKEFVKHQVGAWQTVSDVLVAASGSDQQSKEIEAINPDEVISFLKGLANDMGDTSEQLHLLAELDPQKKAGLKSGQRLGYQLWRELEVLAIDFSAVCQRVLGIDAWFADADHDDQYYGFLVRTKKGQLVSIFRTDVTQVLLEGVHVAQEDLPAGGVGRPTEDESSGIPASPSSARRRRTMPDVASAEEDDGDAGSIPSHPSQVEDEDGSIGDRAFTEPVMPTMADVSEADIDMSECVSKILEGLRGDAFSIARDIGLNRLLKPDGIDHLIEQIRQQAFPLQSEEASELFRQGQLLSGPLAKQSGEPMLSYIARRKRWWSTLCELDPDIRLSEAMRANLLVELSGLSRQEQLMVKTAARSQTTDEFARVLVQHHSVVHMKERLLTEKERPNTQRTGYRPWLDRQQHQTPKFGYMGYGYEEFEVTEPDQGTIPEEDLQEAAYPALGSPPDDESWIDDEEVAMQLNAYTAVSEEIGVDDIDEDYAEAVQLAYAATNTLSTAKGKGKGKGKDKGGKGKSGGKLVKSNLTIADRKAKLQELKSKSRCLRCGVVGHWAGDAECRFKGNAKGAAGKPSATPAQSGGAPKPAPPKPQAYMAVEESDDDEVVILSNSGSQAHGYMAMKSSSTKTGKGSGVLAPRMRRSEASATMRDSPPPGSSTLFTFGQHRGLTYERVVHTYPGYVLWGQREKCPSKNLADFLAWVHEYYVVTDSEPIEVTRRERPLSETPVPVLEQPAAPSTGGPAFYVTCRGGCKEFSKSGSNAYIDMRTCKKCGAVTKTKKEKPVIDQATCLHGVTERTGSSRKTSRLRCKLCGMLLDEQPQDERKKRSEIAATVQESNTLDFDLLRSIASRTSEDLPVEVVVPAIDQFRETVEGHFATEPSITRGDLIAYLQEALEDQLPQESHNTSWEIASASAGGRSRSTRSYKIPDPPVPLNVRVAAADRGQGTSEGQGSAHDRTMADTSAMEPCTFVRPSIVTREGRAEAHRGFQAMLREYDEACTAAGIAPEAGDAAQAARSFILIAEPEAARAAGIESYAERFHRECLELEEEEAAAAAAGPAAPTAGAASSSTAAGAAAAMEVDDDSFVLPPDLAGAASAAPPTAEEVPSSTPSYASPTPKVHYDAGPVFKPPPAELLQQQAPIAPVIRPAVPPIPAGAPPPPTGPPTKAPAVDANKEYIGKLRAEKEALLAENGRLSRALRDTEEELAETRRHPRDAQFDSRRANRAERQLDDLRGRRSRSRRRSYSPRDRRGDDRDRRDYRDRRDDPEERRYRRDDSRDIDRGDFRRMDSRSRVRERSVRADSSSHFNKIGRTARWGRDTAPDAARARSPSPAPPAYPPPPEEVLSHEECLGAPRRNLSSAFTTWDAPGPTRSINFGAFPDGVLTEMYNILGQKVTCISPHTSPSYAPVGKPKDINPIGHLYSHSDVENRDTVSWCYEGTVYPFGMPSSSTPGEAGEAERACPSAPTDEDSEVYIVLWQYPLAFASDIAPMDLTDREELSHALEDSPDTTAVSGAIAARAAGPPGDQDTDPEDEELISDVEMAKASEEAASSSGARHASARTKYTCACPRYSNGATTTWYNDTRRIPFNTQMSTGIAYALWEGDELSHQVTVPAVEEGIQREEPPAPARLRHRSEAKLDAAVVLNAGDPARVEMSDIFGEDIFTIAPWRHGRSRMELMELLRISKFGLKDVCRTQKVRALRPEDGAKHGVGELKDGGLATLSQEGLQHLAGEVFAELHLTQRHDFLLKHQGVEVEATDPKNKAAGPQVKQDICLAEGGKDLFSRSLSVSACDPGQPVPLLLYTLAEIEVLIPHLLGQKFPDVMQSLGEANWIVVMTCLMQSARPIFGVDLRLLLDVGSDVLSEVRRSPGLLFVLQPSPWQAQSSS